MIRTLTSIFDAGRASLDQKLEGLTLPNDAEHIQQILKQGLMDLVASKGEYRFSLTMAEDVIFQDAVALLNAEYRLLSKSSTVAQDQKHQKMQSQPTAANPSSSTSIPIVGSTIGGVVGAWLGPLVAVAELLRERSLHPIIAN